MPGVFLGTTNITNVRVGTAAATKVYVGTTEAWSASAGPAFPVIATTNTGFGTSLSGASAVTAPSGTTAGDLLIGFCSHDSASVISEAGNYTMIGRSSVVGAVHQMATFARIATATSSDNFLPTSAAAQDYCASVLRITGHGVSNLAADLRVSGNTGEVVSTIDPPPLTTGISTNWLWLTAATIDATTGNTISAVPSGYTQAHASITSAASTSSSVLAVASKQAAASSEDPGVWTNSTRVWVAATIAVPPVGTTTRSGVYIAGSSVQQNTGSAPRVIQPDFGTMTDDLVVLIHSYTASVGSYTLQAGWTELVANTTTGTLGTAVWIRKRGASETNYSTGTASGSLGSGHTCLTIRGWQGTIGNVVAGTVGTRAGSGGTFTTTAPTVTTTVNGSLVLCVSNERSTATETGISSVSNSFVELLWAGHHATGGGIETTWVGTRMMSTAGAVGATNVVYPNTQASNGAAVHIYVRP